MHWVTITLQKAVKSNRFSKHDNRHAFQSSGVYFGQGLGKRLVKDFEINQHRSDNHISWSSSLPTYISTYKAGYSGSREGLSSYGPSTQRADAALLKKFHTPNKLTFRRFPRSHGFPEDPPNTKPTTCTTDWFQDGAYSTPLSVLAATQQPFLKHNPWTFSFWKN